MTGRIWAWLRLLGGAAILALLLWRLGTTAFLDGLRLVDGGTLLAALAIGLLTTVLSAWRWLLVAEGLAIRLPLRAAIADYYRSLFLNAALPGGVLGDVHRAVRHGRNVGDVGRGVRAVLLERVAGQLTLVAVTVTVLLAGAFPVPLRADLVPAGRSIAAAGATVAVALCLAGSVLAWRRARRDSAPRRLLRPKPQRCHRHEPEQERQDQHKHQPQDQHKHQPQDQHQPRWIRTLRVTGRDIRHGLLSRRTAPWIAVSSALVLAGHLATFVVAARAAGATAPISSLLPLLSLALLAMALPVNIGGWGPREGVCAWAFGAAGLGAAQGLTTAVVYGLMAFVASLPGAGVLLVRSLSTGVVPAAGCLPAARRPPALARASGRRANARWSPAEADDVTSVKKSTKLEFCRHMKHFYRHAWR